MPEIKNAYDIIILGAGPAGLFAAGAATALGRRVLILEKSPRPAVKLLLAGGGKGNVTNTSVSANDYIGENPAFAAEALRRYTPDMLLRRLDKAGIAFEEREEGRIFCVRSAKDMLDLLLKALPAERCRIMSGCPVSDIAINDGSFWVRSGERVFTAPRLIAATGSAAWPQCGADDSGLRLMRGLGHRIVPGRPVLVPLVLPPDSPFADLAGISALARVGCGLPDTPEFTEPVLFTHKGISGPAILQISCYWQKGVALQLDFLPQGDMAQLLDKAEGKATPQSILSRLLPDRLCRALLPPHTVDRRVAELSRKDRALIATAVHQCNITPVRTEGLARAEAAAGGVDTAEVDPATLQSKLAGGLFFCGEILDITGRLGGYNLHWAWASGKLAGEAAGKGEEIPAPR